eukprot:COSAG02_NODE_63076_length_264_cov_0.624242_1_plen_48_part_10
MSTQNEESGEQGACQFYCSVATSLCPHNGTALKSQKLTTTDGSQDGSR